jgi:hypothetical protein
LVLSMVVLRNGWYIIELTPNTKKE